MLLNERICSNPILVLAEKQVDEEDRLAYLSSCTLAGGRISAEAFWRIKKAQLTFANLKYL